MTPDETGFLELFPNASADFLARNPQLSRQRPADKEGATHAMRPKLEQRVAATAPRKGRAQAEDSRRFLVVVTSYRCRLIDEDNLCEKYVVDCCRYAGRIPGDGPGKTQIETRQVKVGQEAEERTLVEIFEILP
jgi:hypothetical protein